jgi:uncharacterized integral membrane protein
MSGGSVASGAAIAYGAFVLVAAAPGFLFSWRIAGNIADNLTMLRLAVCRSTVHSYIESFAETLNSHQICPSKLQLWEEVWNSARLTVL